MDQKPEIVFGIPGEWPAFQQRYPLFIERFANLEAALGLVLVREAETSEPNDRVLFFLGRVCAEEFFEILLLCGNGYGIAGLRILRGMYERVVTSVYLHLHPEETDNFLDYHWVQQHRLTEAILRTFGESALPKQTIEEVESNYDRVRDRFMVTDCKKCGTKRLNHTWSKLDFLSMARAVGTVGEFIVPAYYLPTRQAHSTVASILSRLERPPARGLIFDPGPQVEQAWMALSMAHNLLLKELELQREHFKLEGVEEPLRKCIEDYRDIWLAEGSRYSKAP